MKAQDRWIIIGSFLGSFFGIVALISMGLIFAIFIYGMIAHMIF